MNTNPVLATILALLPLFFRNNTTVAEIEVILPQVIGAAQNAHTGAAFSVAFPESFGGHAGTSTFTWTPTAPAA